MLATMLVGPDSSLRTAWAAAVGGLRQAKFQHRRLRGIRRQGNPIAVRQPLLGNDPLAVDGNSQAAPQVLDDPTVRVANDFGMFAGEVRRVEDEVAHHAAPQHDAGLVELANDRTFGDWKDELEFLAHAVLPVCLGHIRTIVAQSGGKGADLAGENGCSTPGTSPEQSALPNRRTIALRIAENKAIFSKRTILGRIIIRAWTRHEHNGDCRRSGSRGPGRRAT